MLEMINERKTLVIPLSRGKISAESLRKIVMLSGSAVGKLITVTVTFAVLFLSPSDMW